LGKAGAFPTVAQCGWPVVQGADCRVRETIGTPVPGAPHISPLVSLMLRDCYGVAVVNLRSARAGPELRRPCGPPSAVHQRAQQLQANLEAHPVDRKVSERFTKATPSPVTSPIRGAVRSHAGGWAPAAGALTGPQSDVFPGESAARHTYVAAPLGTAGGHWRAAPALASPD
jgi:hypothetical protein